MKKVLIIYHREDNDGVCSAAIIKSFLTKYGREKYSFDFIGASYADLADYWNNGWNNDDCGHTSMADWVLYDQIYMVDISFNDPDAMQWMYDILQNNFIWCDHHKPAIDLSQQYDYGKCNGVRRTDQSAILNTWDWMSAILPEYSGLILIQPEPSEWIKMLSDYDSWAYSKMDKYKKEANREWLFNFNTGVTHTSNLKIDWFTNWITNWFEDPDIHIKNAIECVKYGTTIRTLDKTRQSEAIHQYGDTNWFCGDRKMCMLFTTERMNSLSFSGFLDTDIKNGGVLKYDNKTDKWILSLYNVNDNDDFDCGQYLKDNYGGGGHKGAAGCTLTKEQVVSLLLNREL